MKPLSDAIQTLITLPGSFAFAGCVVVVIVLLQCIKFARVAIRGLWWCVGMVRKALLRLTWRTAVVVALFSVGLMSFRFQVHDALQLLERNYLDPTYISPSDTSAFALSCYENALSRNLSESEAETVKQRTRQLAARVGSTPLAIYEVAWSECGLNPFTIRKDGLAAGWIQFTSAGLDGLSHSLDQVKQACQRRDIGLIMDLTDAYILRAANGRNLPTSTDIYIAVFAPAFIGMPDNTVLYSGWSRPSYYLNIGLDGYAPTEKKLPDGRAKIVWVRQPDGKITIHDMRLALAAKRHGFLKQ